MARGFIGNSGGRVKMRGMREGGQRGGNNYYEKCSSNAGYFN